VRARDCEERVFWNPTTEVVRVLTLDVSEVNELEREERVD